MTILAGKGIVVTRPAAQAEGLCKLLSTRGATPIRFPTLAILPPRDPAQIAAACSRLPSYDLAIFISSNAVEAVLTHVPKRLPATLKLAVIGQASARALRGFGYEPDLLPLEGVDSAALLALPALHTVAGKKIIIVRGEGGLGVLAETLRARGAKVDYAEVYRRARPTADPAPLLALWQRGAVAAVTATSNEGLDNLVAMVGTAGWFWLCATPLVVVSPRARVRALELGWRAPVGVAAEAGDSAVITALIELFQNQR